MCAKALAAIPCHCEIGDEMFGAGSWLSEDIKEEFGSAEVAFSFELFQNVTAWMNDECEDAFDKVVEESNDCGTLYQKYQILSDEVEGGEKVKSSLGVLALVGGVAIVFML